METLEKLFAEAEQFSEKRKQVLNKLIEKTENEIIPSFSKLLKNYDLNIAYFDIYYNKPFKHKIESQRDEEGNEFWAIGIESDGTIWDCKKDIYSDEYEKCKNYKLENDNEHASLENVTFLRNSIVSIVKEINNRVEKLNEKYIRKIEDAERFL